MFGKRCSLHPHVESDFKALRKSFIFSVLHMGAPQLRSVIRKGVEARSSSIKLLFSCVTQFSEPKNLAIWLLGQQPNSALEERPYAVTKPHYDDGGVRRRGCGGIRQGRCRGGSCVAHLG